MKNMKVAKKLMTGFLIMILLSVVIAAVGILGMSSINNSASNMYDHHIIPVTAMGDLRELFANERNDIRRIFLDKEDMAAVKNTMEKFADYDKTSAEYFAQYEASITDIALEKDYFDAKEAWYGPFQDMKKEMWACINAGDFDGAYDVFMKGSAVIAPITNGFAASANSNNLWAQEAKDDAGALFFALIIAQLAVLVVAVIIACVLALYISGLISKPISPLTKFMNMAGMTGDITLTPADAEIIGKYSQVKDEIGQCIASTANFIKRMHEVSDVLEKIANGDLTVELKLLSATDTMGVSLQKMIGNLNNMFMEINTSSRQVSIASKQIADGAQSLAQGSTEQASSIQQLSASIHEVAEQTKQNADIARKAAALSDTIKGNAEKGSAQMNEMMQAVKEINDASSQIEKVIKVIDDIAFQTNILALNAAVEAARAGQHGKGFAVVAEEVRNLAAKSAEAANDSGGLIENSIEKADFGLQIATETSASLKDIVEGINQNAEIVAQIARSSDEQAGAIVQINSGIDQVAQVVQQNSATAEESAAASEQMSGQSDILAQLISQFALKDPGSAGLHLEVGHRGEYGRY